MGQLEGKTAVITGSTRGLGLAIARAYAREGAQVVVSSRSAEATQRTVNALREASYPAAGLACDVGSLEQVEQLASFANETFGGFDIWVNNAGLASPYGPLAEIAPADFTRVLLTNIFGSYYGSLVALHHLLPKKSGKLINILGRGEEGPGPMQIAYTSSKAWGRSFTLALAKENRDSGVGIFAFNPGLMITEFLTDVTVIHGYAERLKPFHTVVEMWGENPEVPAEKTVWLASSATDGKTGLLVRQSNFGKLVGGAARYGLNSLLGKGSRMPEIRIKEIQPDKS